MEQYGSANRSGEDEFFAGVKYNKEIKNFTTRRG
jgi:hypothetical protein